MVVVSVLEFGGCRKPLVGFAPSPVLRGPLIYEALKQSVHRYTIKVQLKCE